MLALTATTLEEPTLGKDESHVEAQHGKVKNKAREQNRNTPLPDLNERLEMQEAQNEKSQKAEKEATNTRQRKERISVSKQAASETEHVVVRGLDKGKTIMRTVIMDDDDTMELESPYIPSEHHQDPPSDDDHGDVMMVESEEEDRDSVLRRGLGHEGGLGCNVLP